MIIPQGATYFWNEFSNVFYMEIVYGQKSDLSQRVDQLKQTRYARLVWTCHIIHVYSTCM